MIPGCVLLLSNSVAMSSVYVPQILPRAVEFDARPPLQCYAVSFNSDSNMAVCICSTRQSRRSVYMPIFIVIVFPILNAQEPPGPINVDLWRI